MTSRYKWLAADKVEDFIHKTWKFSSITAALLEIDLIKACRQLIIINDDYMLRFTEYFSIPKPA